MIDVLLVNPPLDRLDGQMCESGAPPLGLMWIAALLQSRGYIVELADLGSKKSNLAGELALKKPKVVAIGGYTHSRFESFAIANEVKRANPGIITVYGGHHATFASADTLAHVGSIDIVVRGEGELTMAELADYLVNNRGSLDAVPGISYRRKGEIVHNPSQPRLNNLDNLPWPSWDLLNLNNYYSHRPGLPMPTAGIIAARGCPYHCIFCAARKNPEDSYRKRPAGNVADEVGALIEKLHVRGIIFYDAVFTADKAYVISLCEEFRRREFNIAWSCTTRADCVDFDTLGLMKECGCRHIEIGLETTDPYLLNKIRKNITLAQVEHFIECADELKMSYNIFMMCGLPFSSLEDDLQAAEYISNLQSKHPLLMFDHADPTTIYPGTLLEAFAKKKRFLPEDFSWSKYYLNKKHKEYRASVRVPILIRPGFGYPQYDAVRNAYLREARKRKLRVGFILKAVYGIRSWKGLRHLWGRAKLLLE